jgi:pimeloyl-ACP methyl ester carboxylesterase
LIAVERPGLGVSDPEPGRSMDDWPRDVYQFAVVRGLPELRIVGFAQGAAGYARDFVLATSDWPFDPSAIRVPVDLWYGGHDTSTVHSPDLGVELARRIPGARRHLLPEAGGSLLWTHAEEILASLTSAG